MKRLTFEVDTEPYAVSRDEKIEALAKDNNVEVVQRVSHTLYNVENVIQVPTQDPQFDLDLNRYFDLYSRPTRERLP